MIVGTTRNLGPRSRTRPLRFGLAAVALSLLTGLAVTAHAQSGLSSHTLTHDDQTRTYLRYLPPAVSRSGAAVELMVLLHGGGGAGPSMMRYTRFNALAREFGFITLYPSGLSRQWNDGRQHYQGVDDVRFILAMIDKTVAETGRVDEARIFLAGMSNGGHMSQRLACEKAERFAGIAVVTSQFTSQLIAKCRPSRRLAVLYLNGTEDPLVPYDGGTIAPQWGGRGTATATDQTIEFWRRHNGCERSPKRTLLGDLDDGDGTRIEQLDWPDCAPSAPLRLFRIVGGGHTWPGKMQYLPQSVIGRTSHDADGSRLIWQFFRSTR